MVDAIINEQAFTDWTLHGCFSETWMNGEFIITSKGNTCGFVIEITEDQEKEIP